jgi:hypothetical protein
VRSNFFQLVTFHRASDHQEISDFHQQFTIGIFLRFLAQVCTHDITFDVRRVNAHLVVGFVLFMYSLIFL